MYPNPWSIIDNTPKGVTIHLIDEGIDTGDILFQREVELKEDDTISSSYWRLRTNIEDLFIKNWDSIKIQKFQRRKQRLSEGTFHLKKNSEKYFEKLGILDGNSSFNWDITVSELRKRHKIYKK
jgi:methionyl-tRNA formyltransferase